MTKIEDYKLQMYVDNELSKSEMKEIEVFLSTNSEAQLKVDSYRKINNLVFENLARFLRIRPNGPQNRIQRQILL